MKLSPKRNVQNKMPNSPISPHDKMKQYSLETITEMQYGSHCTLLLIVN